MQLRDLRLADGRRVRAILLLVLTELTLGTAVVFVRFALSGTGAVEAAFLRLLIAAPIALAVAALRRVDLRCSASEFGLLVLAGIFLALHFVAWIESVRLTTVAISTLLVCTTPFFLAVYDAMQARRLPPLASLLAFPVAAAATVVIVLGGKAAPSGHDQPLLGGALALFGALLIGAYLLIIRSLRRRRSTNAVIAYVYPSAAVAMACIALPLHAPPPQTALSWSGILGMALFTQIVGHTSLAASLKHFRAGTVAFAGLAEPPISVIAAALIFAEPLTPATIAAGLVLLAAIAVVLAQDVDAATTEAQHGV